MGVTGGPRSSSSSQRPVVVAVGGLQPGRALLHNARAFRPGGRWCGGVPLVLSDCRRCRRGARLWPLVGRGLVAPQCQRCMLLCDVGSSLVTGS